MVCGPLVGAVIALRLFTLAGDTWRLTMTGAGLAFGLDLGAIWDMRET